MFWIKPTKVKAFTLSEMLVVMATTTIILGFCFLILRWVQNYFNNYTTYIENKTIATRTAHHLRMDFNRFENIFVLSENQLLFYSPLDTVRYQMESNYLIRRKDTVKIKGLDFIFYNRGEAVQVGAIDALDFTINGYKKQRFFIFQYISSAKRRKDGF